MLFAAASILLSAWPHARKPVAKAPEVVISAARNNYFYAGIDNPISALAEGCPSDSLVLTTEKGSIHREGDYFVAHFDSTGVATINAMEKLPGHTLKNIGSDWFRIIPLPLPIVQVGNLPGDSVRAGLFAVQQVLLAHFVSDNLIIDINIPVISYSVKYLSGARNVILERQVKGPSLLPVLDLMQQAKASDTFIFENIMVRMPDGKIHKSGNLIYELY